jgi:uncharacterized protein (DUF2141 family)
MQLPRLAALAAVALVASAAHADGEAKVTLSVNTSGMRNGTGQLIVALFNGESGWPKLDKALRLEKVKLAGKGASVGVSFKDLPPGIYGVAVIHDENENGKLDMRWLPYPKPIEGAAASNNPQPTLGPPSWGESRFKLTEKGGALAIQMRYW